MRTIDLESVRLDEQRLMRIAKENVPRGATIISLALDAYGRDHWRSNTQASSYKDLVIVFKFENEIRRTRVSAQYSKKLK